MKYFYIAANYTENDKNYAYIIKVSQSDNLISVFEKHRVDTANLYHTKKQAETIVNHWNACYKANGTYMF
jgi:hypothetical protein